MWIKSEYVCFVFQNISLILYINIYSIYNIRCMETENSFYFLFFEIWIEIWIEI